MDFIDEIVPIVPIFRKVGHYVWRNVEWPTREYEPIRFRDTAAACIVGIYDIVASVHPNYYAAALIASLAAVFVYIKIRFPFWNNQPVVHTYDWYRRWMARTPYVILKFPLKHKWCCSGKHVQTLDYSRISGVEKQKIAEFLQSHYLPSDRLLSTTTAKTLDVYMTGHNAPAFVSAYTEDGGTITGIATSRLAHVWFRRDPPSGAEPERSLDVYYMDMCIHREQPASRRIAETLFQSHEYNQRIRNPAIAVGLFRKQGALCEGVVPLVEYTTHTFYLRPMETTRPLGLEPLPAPFRLVRVAKENGDLLHDIYKILTESSVFGGCILPDLGNFRGMLVAKEWYLYCLQKGDHVYGVYVFRNAHTHYEDIEGDTLELAASIQNSESVDLFFRGVVFSLREIRKENRQYKMAAISSLGHNRGLLAKWREYHHTVLETQCALYLYNYVWTQRTDDWFVVL